MAFRVNGHGRGALARWLKPELVCGERLGGVRLEFDWTQDGCFGFQERDVWRVPIGRSGGSGVLGLRAGLRVPDQPAVGRPKEIVDAGQ